MSRFAASVRQGESRTLSDGKQRAFLLFQPVLFEELPGQELRAQCCARLAHWLSGRQLGQGLPTKIFCGINMWNEQSELLAS